MSYPFMDCFGLQSNYKFIQWEKMAKWLLNTNRIGNFAHDVSFKMFFLLLFDNVIFFFLLKCINRSKKNKQIFRHTKVMVKAWYWNDSYSHTHSVVCYFGLVIKQYEPFVSDLYISSNPVERNFGLCILDSWVFLFLRISVCILHVKLGCFV